jgi:hypothetical protein
MEVRSVPEPEYLRRRYPADQLRPIKHHDDAASRRPTRSRTPFTRTVTVTDPPQRFHAQHRYDPIWVTLIHWPSGELHMLVWTGGPRIGTTITEQTSDDARTCARAEELLNEHGWYLTSTWTRHGAGWAATVVSLTMHGGTR